MAMHLVPPGTRPANPAPVPTAPSRELRRIADQVQAMNPPDDDREACGWPEHGIDQRYIRTVHTNCEDDEDGDGY